jgi:hypothetical protein
MIMRNSIYISTVLLALVFMGCETPYTIDLNQAKPQIVIEGMVTDYPGHQSVKVSMSGGFYSAGKTPRVTDATVSVKDDLGESFTFVHNPNSHPDSAGYYVPVQPFTGQIGRTYTLKVEANGKAYESTDKLVKVLPLDSITYDLSEEEVDNPENDGKVYEVKMFAHEDKTTKNFYLFKFFRNDTLTFDSESDIYYTDDTLLGEKLEGVPAPVFYRHGEKCTVEIYSISRVGYVFYNDLFNLLHNDSGMFSPIPASPRSNISNDALGFFQVSQLVVSELKIE